jgi:hypothetical protein
VFTEVLWSREVLLVAGHKDLCLPMWEKKVYDLPRLGYRVTSVSLEMLQGIDAIVCED